MIHKDFDNIVILERIETDGIPETDTERKVNTVEHRAIERCGDKRNSKKKTEHAYMYQENKKPCQAVCGQNFLIINKRIQHNLTAA